MEYKDLFKPKWKHSDHLVRKAGVEKLEDQQILADIAKNDKVEDVRQAAVEKLEDQKLLADIAKNDEHWIVRQAAVEKLEDQEILTDIAKNDKDEDVRQAAVKKLDTDKWQDLLKRISSFLMVFKDLFKPKWKHSDWYVRIVAVEKLEEQDLLAEIAKNDKHWGVRRTAVEKLVDQRLLADIAKNNIHEDIRIEAVKKLEDQDLLANIAENEEHHGVRYTAVLKLDSKKWQDLLAKIAKNDGNWKIRKKALEKLEDQEVLPWVAKNHEHENVRNEAAWELDSEKFSLKIGPRIFGSSLMLLMLLFTFFTSCGAYQSCVVNKGKRSGSICAYGHCKRNAVHIYHYKRHPYDSYTTTIGYCPEHASENPDELSPPSGIVTPFFLLLTLYCCFHIWYKQAGNGSTDFGYGEVIGMFFLFLLLTFFTWCSVPVT